jgi:hypothetical protein
VIILFCFISSELKIYIHTKTYTEMFRTAVFIISQIWKQQRCPSTYEWLNKIWYTTWGNIFSTTKNWSIKAWKDIKKKLNDY